VALALCSIAGDQNGDGGLPYDTDRIHVARHPSACTEESHTRYAYRQAILDIVTSIGHPATASLAIRLPP